ncbi:ATP-binding cassette domain-containing protein [Escherichia coli]|uniref:ATP-binding cassette domain-containing protein n=1 Tax=Escherichia coli TaxID=562 RepID=UPI000D121A33|nr:ATP-binding cassette domain-containing protein [Escherichia coli]MCW7197947.1 ATP-binding cassette domain-containing protein [Escherichia coli]
METFLSLRHINKTFHATRALRDVSLDFMSGEVHCLAGQNGCGKSTLIKIMSGVYRPDEGAEITLGGKKLVKADTRRFGGAGDSGDLSGPLFIS